MKNLSDSSVIVVGGSRGLGSAIADAFAQAEARVIAVSRTGRPPDHHASPSNGTVSVLMDAAKPGVASALLERYDPDIVVIVAGELPHMVPLTEQSWATFSIHWHSDVRIAFEWIRAALLKPLRPDSRVIVFSSGAALGGSPLSGGYAGAKATQRFITAYAQDEARRLGLDIAFTAVLPRFAPDTGIGREAVAAYAARNSLSVEQFLDGIRRSSGPTVTTAVAASSTIELVQTEAANLAPSYVLTGTGMEKSS